MPLIPLAFCQGRKEIMKKVKINIPPELYTKNVEKIIDRSLHDLETEPPYLTSFLCDPQLTEDDLEKALKVLKSEGKEITKQKLIKAELEARRRTIEVQEFPEDLREEWEEMRRAAAKRKEIRDEKKKKA